MIYITSGASPVPGKIDYAPGQFARNSQVAVDLSFLRVSIESDHRVRDANHRQAISSIFYGLSVCS